MNSKAWTDQVRQRVKSMIHAGKSTNDIAAAVGVTLGAATGRIWRDRELRELRTAMAKAKPLFIHPANPTNAIGKKMRAARPVSQPVKVPPAPFECRSVPMMELEPGDCKFPVNDAAKGETHLFCGNPAIGVYCGPHMMRAIGRPTEGERTALRVLERAAA